MEGMSISDSKQYVGSAYGGFPNMFLGFDFWIDLTYNVRKI